MRTWVPRSRNINNGNIRPVVRRYTKFRRFRRIIFRAHNPIQGLLNLATRSRTACPICFKANAAERCDSRSLYGHVAKTFGNTIGSFSAFRVREMKQHFQIEI